ncbi:MAG: prepilin peptidase, partial [Arthrobacter sp.]
MSAENLVSTSALLVLGAALLGATLSAIAEILIARLLPRLGDAPHLQTKITTAALTGLTCAAFAQHF